MNSVFFFKRNDRRAVSRKKLLFFSSLTVFVRYGVGDVARRNNRRSRNENAILVLPQPVRFTLVPFYFIRFLRRYCH